MPWIRKLNMNWKSFKPLVYFKRFSSNWDHHHLHNTILGVDKKHLQNYLHLLYFVSWNVHDDFLCMSVGPLHILRYCCCTFAIAAKWPGLRQNWIKIPKCFLGSLTSQYHFQAPHILREIFFFEIIAISITLFWVC